jgi:hypothetical protein
MKIGSYTAWFALVVYGVCVCLNCVLLNTQAVHARGGARCLRCKRHQRTQFTREVDRITDHHYQHHTFYFILFIFISFFVFTHFGLWHHAQHTPTYTKWGSNHYQPRVVGVAKLRKRKWAQPWRLPVDCGYSDSRGQVWQLMHISDLRRSVRWGARDALPCCLNLRLLGVHIPTTSSDHIETLDRVPLTSHVLGVFFFSGIRGSVHTCSFLTSSSSVADT